MTDARLDAWCRGLVLGFLALYLVCRSYLYYFDGVTFAMAVEGVAGGASPRWLLHPHHLLYNVLAYGAFRSVTAAGLYPRALLVMQWLSALFAVLGLRLFYGTLRAARLDPLAALAGTILLGASYGYWHFATTGDTTMAATVCLIAEMAAMIRFLSDPSSAALPALIGALQALSFLMHETTAVFAPAALWLLWRGAPSSRRRRACLTFAGVAATLTASAYVAAAAVVLGVRTPREFFAWLFFYFGPDPRTGYHVEYGSFAWSNLLSSLRAWVGMFVGPAPAQTAPSPIWTASASAAVAVLVFSIGALGLPRGGTSDSLFRRVLALGVGVHAAVFSWWDPGNVHFWVMALPAWCFLAAVGAARLGAGSLSRGAGLVWWGPLLLSIALVAGPLAGETSPRVNRFLSVAETIAANTEPESTVIISGEGRYSELKAYVPYIARRRMLILDFQFADKTIPVEKALALLDRRIRRMAANGGAYLLSEALDPALDGHFARRHGLSGARRRAFFAAFDPTPCAEIGPALRLLRLHAG